MEGALRSLQKFEDCLAPKNAELGAVENMHSIVRGVDDTVWI
jgi:hypothetical protein